MYQIDWWCWGQKFSHSTCHNTLEEAQKTIDDHWKKYKNNNPCSMTSNWYLFPRKPKLVKANQ